MITDSRRNAAIVLLSLLAAGCVGDDLKSASARPDSFGEANRQTMMAQVIDPTPEYDTQVPVSSGDHAAQAIDRYRKDQVKKPEKVKTTNAGNAGGGAGGSGGN